jgi:Cu-processing system permease protein
MELLLAQPVKRSSIFAGKLAGLSASLCALFLAGTAVPFLLRATGTGRDWSVFLTMLLVGCAFIVIFTAIAFLIGSLLEDRLKGFGAAIILWFYLSVIHDALIVLTVYLFREYPLERGLIGLALLNPVDLGRILILLRLDISALMGYTGAVFRSFFGSSMGIGTSAAVLILWLVLPVGAGLFAFNRKDF